MKIIHAKRTGFTLLELMLAVVISSIVASVVGILLISANRTLIRNHRIVEMQREVSLAMKVIGDQIRATNDDADDISFLESGALHSLYFDSGMTSGVIWDESTGELTYEPSGLVLVGSDLEVVEFQADEYPNGSWYVLLQVYDDETMYELIIPSNFLPRNSSLEDS